MKADLLEVMGRLANEGWLSCLDRRVDWVALVSVVSSGVVAVATVLVSVFQRRGDRKHEKSLAFEERIFERKTEALLAAIALLRPFVQVLAAHQADRDVRYFIEADMQRVLDTFNKNLRKWTPAIEAFASDKCREDALTLRRAIDAVPIKSEKVEEWAALADGEMQAESGRQLELWDELRLMNMFLPVIAQAAEAFLESARRSIAESGR
ncbi:MAG: hypothetical protein QME72_13160 [Rhodococcus sp. (in: high G+C Gram-positive bacteria)]|nr:hypothetical protein [Rhodococcus sp. (in: high G+C Gram-positive bacteria)]MDI6628657.1 hypothetical protein [Rhodococcus sp. (in: high G+C Gram-positive bacteria)]